MEGDDLPAVYAQSMNSKGWERRKARASWNEDDGTVVVVMIWIKIFIKVGLSSVSIFAIQFGTARGMCGHVVHRGGGCFRGKCNNPQN